VLRGAETLRDRSDDLAVGEGTGPEGLLTNDD
jgi:hypothetical protein